MTFELSYEFRGKTIVTQIEAATAEEAVRRSRIVNPTLVVSESHADPRARYLKSENGTQFVELLRKFEHTLYAKVRNMDKFRERYKTATGESLPATQRILLSEQQDKWGDEMLITFSLGDFSPNFPSDAKPRKFESDGDRWILNDNAYVWFLIENHGFRFGRN